MQAAKAKTLKFVLVGGDAGQARAYSEAASGYELVHYASMSELGFLGRFREFDAAIVHQNLSPLSGLELAEYLEKLFHSLPMILLTAGEEIGQALLPSSIVACLPAYADAERVLDRVLRAVRLRSAPYLSVLDPL